MDKNTESIIDVVTVDEKKNKTKKTIIKVVSIFSASAIGLCALGGVVLYNIIGIFYIPNYSVAIIIVSLIILFKHRENIARLIAHQEGKIR